ncbi:MAG: CoA-transferase, partial [Alphaproteobacteria bacterium]|nr:CoA-transferase [Alphaproteobacteria bacterium]
MALHETLTDAVSLIRPGITVAIPPEYCGIAMAATCELIRRGIGELHLVAVPQSGLQADMLIGAGHVKTLEAAAITMGERGPAPRFAAAIKAGAITMMDATCPAIHAALQASEKGLPFLPLRGILGSDVLAHRPDWQIIDNPFGTKGPDSSDPIVALPAIRPDVALFHCEMADREGNLWIGRRRELATMAHASAMTVATVETIHDGNFFDDEILAAGALPAAYVDAIAHAPRGAWPLGMPGTYDADGATLDGYCLAAA